MPLAPRTSEDVSIRWVLVLGRRQLRLAPARLRGERGMTWPTRRPSSVTQHRATAALWARLSCGSPMCIGARTDSGGRYTAMPTSPTRPTGGDL